MIRFMRKSVLMALAFGLTACGPSKADLQAAHQQLQQATSDRDDLKAQLEQANSRIASLEKQLTELRYVPIKPATESTRLKKTAKESHAFGTKRPLRATRRP